MPHRPLIAVANTYLEANLVRVSVTFRDANGVAADPDAVTGRFRRTTDAGVVGALTTFVNGTDAELVKDATGQYHIDISLVGGGRYRYSFTGDPAGGTLEAHGEAHFDVRESDLLP